MTQREIAAAVGYRSRAAVAMWPDELRLTHVSMLIGVAVRTGREIPKEFLK